MLAMEIDEERKEDWNGSYQTAQFGHEADEERKAKLEKMVATAQLILALIKDCGRCGCGFCPSNPF